MENMEKEKLSDEEIEELQQLEQKKRFSKPFIWLLVFCLLLNTIAILPETFSWPAIKFLKTSAQLSKRSDIQAYKRAVVAITSGDARGTGFSISNDGKILTNRHIVGENKEVVVSFPKRGPYIAKVVQTYPALDLAVLQIEKHENDFPFLTLAEKSDNIPNREVIIIGNPLRFQGIANKGTIIDTIQLQSWDDEVAMVQAPIYRGNSGSPVINEHGEVIGVIFATLNHKEHGKVGLFIPIELYHNRRTS